MKFKSKWKTTVIGLDCGSFRFIKPYAKEGWLPNLKNLMTNGVTRVLKSTIPPVSPPAWTTFLTGKNPGKHGIFQFVDMDARNYAFTKNRIINSSLFSGNTFIDFISNHNLKVGIVKIPFTYPPWKVNGFMVAGEPSPDWTKAHTYPPELSETIGRVNMGSSIDFMRYSTEDLLKHLIFDCSARTRITCEMIEKESYDFFMVVHNITDAAAHRFWKFTDETCPNYRLSFEQYKNVIRDVYIQADKSIGKILKNISHDTTIFIMSDHGATRKPIHFFQINAWLKEMGYLHCKEGKSSVRRMDIILRKTRNLLPPALRYLITHYIKAHFLKGISNYQNKAVNYNWIGTRAYAVRLYTTVDGIVLNVKGRQPNGIVYPGTESENLCNEIQSALLEIVDQRTGKKPIEKVYRREEVFTGKFSIRMPDLIVQYNNDFRSDNGTNLPLFYDVPSSDFDFQSGDHDANGIFIAKGPHIKKGIDLPHAQIQDLAPTILYAMGLPVPKDMDGQVLLDIFDQEFLNKNQIRKVHVSPKRGSDAYELDKAEEDEMKEQLKGLGYM